MPRYIDADCIESFTLCFLFKRPVVPRTKTGRTGINMEDVVIYANGLVHCSVCADKKLSKEEVETFVNSINTTGIDSKWTVSKSEFAGGGKNPGLCDKDETRLHYLMVC
jgi:hypothetical protein